MPVDDSPLYTEAGAITAGLLAIALAIVKTCGSKGLYCRTPCGSRHDCIVDLNEGRPTVDGNSPRDSEPEPNIIERSPGGSEASVRQLAKPHTHKHRKHKPLPPISVCENV